MMRNRGTADASGPRVIQTAFVIHLRQVHGWLSQQPHIKTLPVNYHDVLRDAARVGWKLTNFLDFMLNAEAMARQVDVTLYRNRR
jgi:hypothetical protein